MASKRQVCLWEGMPSSLDADFANWLAGFIDGEGCFYIHSARGTFKPTFRLKLRWDDKSILDEIARKTGLGYVKPVRPSGRRSPQAEWIVITKRDCLLLVKILDAYPLRAKKQADFGIWKHAVNVWSQVRTRSAGWHKGTIRDPLQRKLASLKQALESVRHFSMDKNESLNFEAAVGASRNARGKRMRARRRT